MPLSEAFQKAKKPVLAMSTFVVVLLIVGAQSFFALAYDTRYSQAAIYLPILAVAAWLSIIAGLYGSAFLVKGHSKWLAFATATKVATFILLMAILSRLESTLVVATTVVLVSELVCVLVSCYMGWRLGLKNLRVELAMLSMLLVPSAFGLLVLQKFEPVAGLHPMLQLLVLGLLVTSLFAPLFVKVLLPLFRRRSS